MPGFDVAIIGLGAMGSFTALELAGRGASVVGFDRWSPPHQQGSHGGETRAFRTLYTEHPDYVPLMKRSLELWERLAGECRRDLLTWTGVLSLGEPGSPLIEGVQQSAAVHGLPVQALSGDEVRGRFPALSPPGNFTGLLDTRAGLIDVEAALGCALQEARRLGADLRLDREVLGWSVEGREVWVTTRKERVRARRLVVAAGAWSGAILRALKLPLLVRRQVLTWFRPHRPEWFQPGAAPIFVFAPGAFYGFPEIGGAGVKIAYHERGDPLPEFPVRVPPASEADLAPLVRDIARFVPGLLDPDRPPLDQMLAAKTCLYTLTPDGHFIIDRHPQYEQVLFGAGFSGHGFKFAPLVGEVLADLALEGKTGRPIDFLRLQGRF